MLNNLLKIKKIILNKIKTLTSVETEALKTLHSSIIILSSPFLNRIISSSYKKP